MAALSIVLLTIASSLWGSLLFQDWGTTLASGIRVDQRARVMERQRAATRRLEDFAGCNERAACAERRLAAPD
jgi:hypothetical protein